MAKTYFNEQQIKKWFVSEQSAKKVYHDDKLVFSGGFELVIASSNHNVPANWIWSLLPAAQQAAQGNTIIIKVNPGVELVTASTTINGVFDFSGSWAGKIVVIENSGIILGRGGNAGPYVSSSTYASNGLPGGRAIYHANVLTSLSIDNKGTIGGGGGGGGSAGSSYPTNSGKMKTGGGGGAPFGLGLSAADKRGGDASFAVGGAGATWTTGLYGGAGGTWGTNGGTGVFDPSKAIGGAAGEATRGTITWINRGDIRGATV
jgi:hypothetical protein